MARDVSRAAHLRPGLLVKVVPPDALPGAVVEGVLAELLSGDDPRGVLVRLASGATGHVLRVWEGGDAVKDTPPADRPRDTLPSWNVERPPPPEHKRLRIDERELERKAAEALGPRPGHDLHRLIEEGLGASTLRRFAIDDDELARRTREALAGLGADDLARRLARAPEPEARRDPDDNDLLRRDDDDDDRGDRRGRPKRRRS